MLFFQQNSIQHFHEKDDTRKMSKYFSYQQLFYQGKPFVNGNVHIRKNAPEKVYVHDNFSYSFVFFSWANMAKYVWFFRLWEYAFDQKKTGNFSHQKLFRLLDLTTFHSDHPRKKSGIQLRSQIVWTFHFWSPFYDRRHPQAVRLQSLKFFSGTKKPHTIDSW